MQVRSKSDCALNFPLNFPLNFLHILALKCAAMPEGTEFWAPHSALEQLKSETSSYIKKYEHLLEKTPRTETPGRGNLVMEVKGLLRQ